MEFREILLENQANHVLKRVSARDWPLTLTDTADETDIVIDTFVKCDDDNKLYIDEIKIDSLTINRNP